MECRENFLSDVLLVDYRMESLQRDTAKLSLLVKTFFEDVTCSECIWIDL